MNIAPAAFRKILSGLTPDDMVRLSHESRSLLARALAARTCGNRSGLEIGCWKGETSAWLLDNGVDALTVVDTFAGGAELGNQSPFDHFQKRTSAYSERITVHHGRSADVLPRLPGSFGFVYIDGSHDSRDVIIDAAFSIKMLSPGGIIVFDDYRWNYHDDQHRNPGPAIDFFIGAWAPEIELLETGYQVVLRKR